jgi:6-phosphofructokinase
MKIGILSSGGDCPGINATIRGVGKSALNHNIEVLGIYSGFRGLLDKDVIPLNDTNLSGLLNLGGTILGTSREKPFKKMLKEDHTTSELIKKNYHELGLDCLVCIGGNGTQKTAYNVSQLGLNVITIPKTIDNDVWGTDITFGFDSAIQIATDAIDRLHSTASAHKRVMVIELMGHKAGWLALYAGMAGGADVILLPELGYNMEEINRAILERVQKGKPYSIVVIAEGVSIQGEEYRPSTVLSKLIEKGTNIETRETILGYVQRGGTPTAFDRNLATRLGGHATQLIMDGKFGCMVCMKDNNIQSIPLEETAGKLKMVPINHDLIVQGKRIGISFGV